MKTPSRRQALVAGFLAAFALGLGLLGTVEPWGLRTVLGLGWVAVGILAAWKGLSLAPEAPGTPVPAATGEALAPGDAIPGTGAVPGHPDPEPLELLPAEEADEGVPEEEGPVLSGPALPAENAWTEVLAGIEADWGRSEALEPALREILGNAAFIRENVLKSFEIADNLAGSAQRAFGLSEKVQTGITVVTQALVESQAQAEILGRHSERITRILGLLGEVSDKIHVLSINASIVSARAGAAGRGFEVVAKEIRSLAKETEHSLGDIVEVIEQFRSSIFRVVQVVREADLETQNEKGSLIEVAGALQGVLMGVEVVKMVSEMARTKSEEQEALVCRLIAEEGERAPETRRRAAEARALLEENRPGHPEPQGTEVQT